MSLLIYIARSPCRLRSYFCIFIFIILFAIIIQVLNLTINTIRHEYNNKRHRSLFVRFLHLFHYHFSVWTVAYIIAHTETKIRWYTARIQIHYLNHYPISDTYCYKILFQLIFCVNSFSSLEALYLDRTNDVLCLASSKRIPAPLINVISGHVQVSWLANGRHDI